MESNQTILFFMFGIFLLPKIYSDIYPSLIVKKLSKNYAVADEIQYVEDQNNNIIFSTSPQYQLHNACPRENDYFHPIYALEAQKSVIDFEAKPVQKFIEGDFPKYNCQNPIKPTVLQSKKNLNDNVAIQYDIGYVIREINGNFNALSENYENITELREYNFLHFLTIKMNTYLKTINWVRHRIISRGLLEPDTAFDPLPPNEENADVYGFDVNSLYTKENQRQMFSSIFHDVFFRYYNYPKRCLIKVQLAPHEDFLLNTWKLPSLMDLNTAAMWNQVYPQWRTIEMFIREVARDLEPLIVETGTAKILTLPLTQETSKKVYLRDAQTYPVTQYFWKLVKFEKSVYEVNTRAIFIVMHNDPYVANQKPLCEDMSESWGWMVSNKDYKTGLTYVCPVNRSITTKLHIEYRGRYASLNLNDMQKLESNKNAIYPSLFIIKKLDNNYAVADEFQYIEGENNVFKFSTSPEYQLYNACPEENAPFYPTYALKIKESVKNFEAIPLEQFVQGDFVNYNCSTPIKAIALKSKRRLTNKDLRLYDIGFLIHEKHGNFDKLSEKYENFTEIQEYNFLHFLTILISTHTGVTLEACHQIVRKRLPEPYLPYSDLFLLNEKNPDVYRFDINSLYTEENQANTFSFIFPERYSEYFSYPNQCLRKVQLAPHEDFQLETWKLPSLMDLNTTAMWEQLYPQWRKIELFVREVARKLGVLTIETGAARLLRLQPDFGSNRGIIYLMKGRKFPVFRYMWKSIKWRQTDDDVNTQAILIVMHNDPYSTDQVPICDVVSENLGWAVSNKDYKTGLTYACPVQENIMIQLRDEYRYKGNYAILNLNNVQKL